MVDRIQMLGQEDTGYGRQQSHEAKLAKAEGSRVHGLDGIHALIERHVCMTAKGNAVYMSPSSIEISLYQIDCIRGASRAA